MSYAEIEADFGHDAFLIPNERYENVFDAYMQRVAEGCYMRFDLQVIPHWIKPGSRVLDLAAVMVSYLKNSKPTNRLKLLASRLTTLKLLPVLPKG